MTFFDTSPNLHLAPSKILGKIPNLIISPRVYYSSLIIQSMVFLIYLCMISKTVLQEMFLQFCLIFTTLAAPDNINPSFTKPFGTSPLTRDGWPDNPPAISNPVVPTNVKHFRVLETSLNV